MKAFQQKEVEWNEKLRNSFDEREIRTLLLWACEDFFSYDKHFWLQHPDSTFSISEESKLTEISDRLLKNEPYQYIAGFCYFYDLKINVQKGVLIPRPETEELVEWVLQTVNKNEQLIIEDWCTGSGCIALALKNNLPNAKISGLDISSEALEIARQNTEYLHLSVDFQQKDALNCLSEFENINVIVSNPPYISETEKAQMKPNVLAFEPHEALFVYDEDILLFYDKIAQYALKSLTSGGYLFFEIHEEQGQNVVYLLEKIGFSDVQIRQDLQDKFRMVRARKW